MNQIKMTYTGKKVYVGMDVHKKTYSVTAICEGEMVKRDTMRALPEGLIKYLKKYFEGAELHTVYEAGFCGFGLHRALVASGIDNIVVNPASIEVAANDKVKTDKRDSKKQAEQLSRGALKGIYIPTREEELARVITRTREQVVEHRARVATQIKSKLNYFGVMAFDDERAITESYLEELGKKNLAEELLFGLGLLIAQWRFLTGQIKKIAIKLVEQAAKNEALEKVYRSVPGIGPVSSRVLSNELGDLSKRFLNERSLFSFTGLTPSEHSSGDSIHKGNISRQGSSRIRKYLIEIAWRAIEKDKALTNIFERIAKTRGKKRAIVAIARKLIGRIRACFVHGHTYQLGVVV
ncbi:MAG: IS110 family transposase [Chlamydiota bacterium]|nr:IS110 family transposase [Chlamydiota bacterium]